MASLRYDLSSHPAPPVISDLERLLVAAALAAVAVVLVFWSPGGGKREVAGGLRHPALWVLISLATSFAGTALLHGKGIVVLALLPFLGALWRTSGAQGEPKRTTIARAAPPPKVMTRAEAFEVFGLPPSTTREEVLEAYRHMHWFANPDAGGSEWLIDKLDEARDVLLKR